MMRTSMDMSPCRPRSRSRTTQAAEPQRPGAFGFGADAHGNGLTFDSHFSQFFGQDNVEERVDSDYRSVSSQSSESTLSDSMCSQDEMGLSQFVAQPSLGPGIARPKAFARRPPLAPLAVNTDNRLHDLPPMQMSQSPVVGARVPATANGVARSVSTFDFGNTAPAPAGRSLHGASLVSRSMSSIPVLSDAVFAKHEPLMPVLPRDEDSDRPFDSITPDTLRRALNGEFSDKISKILIIDCRFAYEYDGGHIIGAININTQEDCESYFMHHPINEPGLVIVFHCEFSSKRGPTMHKYLRSLDRAVHMKEYPKLYYRDMFVLEGGYKAWWESNPGMCEPQNYVTMFQEGCEQEKRTGMRTLRRAYKRARSWSDVSRFLKNRDSSRRPMRSRCMTAANLTTTIAEARLARSYSYSDSDEEDGEAVPMAAAGEEMALVGASPSHNFLCRQNTMDLDSDTESDDDNDDGGFLARRRQSSRGLVRHRSLSFADV